MRRALLFLGMLLVLAGCGHPATEKDCDEIVTRIARLELQKQHPKDAKAVERGIETTKRSLRQTTMKDCVGKRITNGAMRCVRNAKTSDEIINRCFN